MAFKEELVELLRQPESGLRDPYFDFEVTSKKVGGFVISPSFEGMSQLDRQNMVWDYLDGRLPQEKLLRIISLITLTPAEAGKESSGRLAKSKKNRKEENSKIKVTDKQSTPRSGRS